VGREGNRAATRLFAGVVGGFGFDVECPEFECIDWTEQGVALIAGGRSFQACPSPYSLGCDFIAPLVSASNLAELEALEARGRLLLLRGELAREQLMPKNFPFYNPDHHKHIIRLLEAKRPAAILAATSKDPEMVGGAVYPFPLIEDGDFDIPSVYMTEEEGDRLAPSLGSQVHLLSRAARHPSTGCNVVARKGPAGARRIVMFAHIDSRLGTPGANDNASGVITLLLTAELLAQYSGQLGVEIVAMNGEDYYCNPGEQLYLSMNAGKFDEILLGLNLDDLAYHKGKVAYSLYNCPADLERTIRQAFSPYPALVEGEPWYQGDHGLFLIHNRPALAFTSELVVELMSEITHTAKDTPDIIDPSKMVDTAHALRDLILQLDNTARA
jgi:aminopeptidase YwaD